MPIRKERNSAMEAIKYLKERTRMCNWAKERAELQKTKRKPVDCFCEFCPMSRFGSEFTVGCYLAENNDPETAISTVEKWGKENKIKTNVQVFEEVFGVVPYVGIGLDSKGNSQIGIKESLREIKWWGEEFKGTVYDSKD